MVSKKRQKTASSKKSKSAPKVNPFELKFNRLKHDVLGKKKGAIGVGHPGLSRKRAYEQREKTIGVEHDRIGKVNKIIDRRIGEKNQSITSEEKASLRFTAERVKHLKKGSKFNLTDDNDDYQDMLTHGGKALTTIQKYDKTLASDDEDDVGNIGADVVKVAHFGGGDLDSATNGEKPTRKDIIADLIARTKQARENKQNAKDDMETATEELDAKYLKILDKVKNAFRPTGATKAEKVERDDYDKLAISLKIDADARATPAERTKTAEELAMEEKLHLEELESLRLARMNAEKNKRGHLSVDAEDRKDGSKKKRKTDGFEVRFDSSGALLDKDKVERVTKKKVAIDSDDELTDEEFEDENEEELDDLLGENEAREDLEVPFVFEMPRSFKALVGLLEKYPSHKMGVVLERLIKCHHPGLAEGNKKLLSQLFLYLLRLFDDYSLSSPTEESVKILGTLTKTLYSLLRFDVEFSVRCVRALIRQNWKKRMNSPKSPTSFSLIALLRLIASLFPVSDRWHPVCSPAMALAAVTLAKCHIQNLNILAQQILLVTVVADYVEESKRFIPEALAFCHGALLMAVENEENERAPSTAFPISLPHRRMLYITENLRKDATVEPVKFSEVFTDNERQVFTYAMHDSDMKRCRVLRSLIAVVQKYRVIYAAHEHTFTATFSPFVDLLKRIPVSRLPTIVADEIEALTRSMEAECKTRSRLTQMSRVTTEKSMLKMLEPRFEEDFDPERPRLSRDQKRKGAKAEKEKLQHLVKKETRGAIKELAKIRRSLSENRGRRLRLRTETGGRRRSG
ncbi:Nop14-like family protein [Ancylostoma caninum]|uniref:Nop14-like family protein n=1 Tax=Ancylostoma caninum TaxID=29170 RepID=A0A368G3X7_ANCCA|nr:Nop14-like family protein [Ancylostoma caninum]